MFCPFVFGIHVYNAKAESGDLIPLGPNNAGKLIS